MSPGKSVLRNKSFRKIARSVKARSLHFLHLDLQKSQSASALEKMLAHIEYYTSDRIPFPTSAVIDTTTRCNLRCRMCARISDDSPMGDLPYEAFQKLSEALIPHLERVDLNGHGETFLNKYFLEMLAEAKKRNVYVGVTTNGTLIDSATAQSLVKLGLDEMVISLDAASAELFEDIRKGARLEKILQNIDHINEFKRDYRSDKPHLHAQMVAMKMNMRELPALVKLAHERVKADSVSVIPLREYTAVAGESILRDPALAKAVISEAREVARKLGIELNISPAIEPVVAEQPKRKDGAAAVPSSNTYMNCEDAWKFTFVAHTAEVRPCCGSSRVLGDLTKQSFPEIWHGEMYRDFRRRLLSGSPPDECLRCVHRARIFK